MSNVSSISNPLMQPIQYNGVTYYTGQYFHQMYRNNSDMNGKYKQTGTFLRLVRSIPTYDKYIRDGDIVEIEWKDVKDSTDADLASVKELFKSNNYNPIMLINATAQVALTHHLDDEVSKKASVAVNKNAVEQISQPRISDVKKAPLMLKGFIEAGAILGTDSAMAKAVAVKQVRNATGIDYEPLLIGNDVKEAPVTPTEIGKLIGDWSGRRVNKALETAGLQIKNDSGEWEATEEGKKYASFEPYAARSSEHSGYRWMWFPSVIELIKKAA